METSRIILIIICAFIVCKSILDTGYSFLGDTRAFCAHQLSDEQKDLVRKYGIIHITTEKLEASIMENKALLAKKGIMHNYSHPKTKNCFFFINQNLADLDLGFDVAHDRNVGITIQNLTEAQISKLRIRDFDNAILYTDNFYAEGINLWSSAKLADTYPKTFPVTYAICLLRMILISAVIHVTLMIIIIRPN